MQDLSDTGRSILARLNAVVEATGQPVEGNLFYHHHTPLTAGMPPDAARAHKRRNFMRAMGEATHLLEIGFNAGHSALLALDGNPALRYSGLDHGGNPWVRDCAGVMADAYRDRFAITYADSTLDLPFRDAAADPVDAVHVDGGHDEYVARSDIHHALRLVRPGGIVLVDDTRHPPIRAAVNEAMAAGRCTVETFGGTWEGDESIALRAAIDPPERRPFTIVYTAVGRIAIREAAISAWSAKRVMPYARTLLVADEQVSSPYFDEVIVLPPPVPDNPARSAKLLKLVAIRAARTGRVLYVDGDTYFMADIAHVFETRRPFDIAAALDTWQFGDIYRRHNGGLPERDPAQSEPFFNSGVIFAVKSEATERFLDAWIGAFAADARIGLEQMTFRDAAYEAGLRVHVLPSTYNARIGEAVHLSGRLMIAHRPSGARDPWETSTPFAADFVNQTQFNRVFIPAERRMLVMDMDFVQAEIRMEGYTPIREQPIFLDPRLTFAAPA